MRIDRSTTDQVFGDLEAGAVGFLQPVQYAPGLRHDFRADAVAGEEEEGFVCGHGFSRERRGWPGHARP
jgi:hypothetical protein